jgi:hypothetical protein
MRPHVDSVGVAVHRPPLELRGATSQSPKYL